MVKINIATPAYNSTYSANFVTSLYHILTSTDQHDANFSLSYIDYSDISVARNYLISNFFFNHPECDYMLFVDSDMGFPASLVKEMLALREDVVGVICPRRNLDLELLHSKSGDTFTKAYASSCSFIGEPISIHPLNKDFAEVDHCGTGILLISRQCVKDLIQFLPGIKETVRHKQLPFGDRIPAYLKIFDKIVLKDRFLSEDFSFCHRWNKVLGRKIYASIGHKIEHRGNLTISTSYASQL